MYITYVSYTLSIYKQCCSIGKSGMYIYIYIYIIIIRIVIIVNYIRCSCNLVIVNYCREKYPRLIRLPSIRYIILTRV